MPNSLNYGSPLITTLYQRPPRLTPADLKLLRMQQAPVIFGTTTDDVVELWIYNPDGSICTHATLGQTDTALRQATYVDGAGGIETINVNLNALADSLGIQPGRYAMVANFFRNEVGSEDGNQLYIADISDDRTELRLVPVELSTETVKQIYEFIVPSVPQQFAKGLIDEVFGVSLDAGDDEKITSSKVEGYLNAAYPGTMTRVIYAQAVQEYLNLYGQIVFETYKQSLDNMAADVFNYNVQQVELEAYIQKALHDVIYSLVQSGDYDPRFVLV